VIKPLLAVENVSKMFGARWALRNVTFCLTPGEIVLLAGPNGAGKTTLLRLLALLTRPNSGRVQIDNVAALEHPNVARARLGFVGHQTLLYDDLTVAENLDFYARLYAVPQPARRIRVIATRLGIEARLNDVTRTLSRGRCCTPRASCCWMNPTPVWIRTRQTHSTRSLGRLNRRVVSCCFRRTMWNGRWRAVIVLSSSTPGG